MIFLWKRKFYSYLCVYLNYIEFLRDFILFPLLQGLDNGILGPSLLDLAGQVNATLSQMNRIFPAQGFGFLMSIILSTIMIKTNCLHLYITLTLGVGAIINVLIPFSTSLGWMTSLFLLQGSTKGLLDTCKFKNELFLIIGFNWSL